MKKNIMYTLALLMILCAVHSSQGYIRINWTQNAPTTEFGETLGVYNGANGVDPGSLVQLLWSVDNVMDPIGLDGSPTGNDQVLDTATVDAIGSSEGIIQNLDGMQYEYTDLVGLSGNAELVAGYVYMRTFDQPSGSIGVGTHYFQGGMTGGPLADSPGNPDNYDAVEYTGGVPTPLDMTIVPEPGTFALFGLGIATLAMRRRLRK